MGIDDQLTAILGEYSAELEAQAAMDVKRAGDDCAKYVRDSAPRDRGVYAQGWRSTLSEDVDGPASTVYNSSREASLAHLLEEGHEQFFMGHDLGYRYPGVPHIVPAYERAASEMIARMHA